MRAQMIRIIHPSMRIVSPHSRLRRPPAGLALALAAALFIGGCGSRLVKVDSSVLRLRIDEYSITPQLVQVHAGRLKLIVVNAGILTHNVRVLTERPNRAGNPNVIDGTGVLLPGQQTGVAAPGQTLLPSPKLDLEPGTYKLVDTIGNHADLGAYGTLIVVK